MEMISLPNTVIPTTYFINTNKTLSNTYNYTGESNNSFLFTGEQFDPESHDYYLRARYYNPKSTRFMSRDNYDGIDVNPITQTYYLYASANPLTYADLSGNMSYAEQTDVQVVQSILAGVAKTPRPMTYNEENRLLRDLEKFLGAG